MATAKDRHNARNAAAEAILAAYNYGAPDSPENTLEEHYRLMRAATAAVTYACVDMGVSHRDIANQTNLGGRIILRHINNVEAREQAMVLERHAAEQYLREVRNLMTRHAVSLERDGVDKIQIAERLNISRPTLDKWLASEVAEEARQDLDNAEYEREVMRQYLGDCNPYDRTY